MLRIPDIEKITYVLTLMGQYELALADFYKHCAAIWTDEQSFWVHLSRAEIRHAENMATMLAIITQKKEKFEAGRPFNAIALNTAMTGLRDNTRRLTAGEFSQERALIVTRDIENSILEAHYAEIVKTSDIEYLTLLTDIISQTYEHRKSIQEKIDATKATA